MARYLTIFSVAFCALSLMGCSSGMNGFSNGSPQLVASPDNVSSMLADAAERASKALETLAAVEYSRTPTVDIAPVNNAPTELRRAITVNWIGPAETITKTLADRAGYSFMAIGNTPPVPIVVAIDATNTPIIDVLRDVGLQLGTRGDVRVDSSQKIVEIHYPPNTGVGRAF